MIDGYWEDVFEIYRRDGYNGREELIASNMSLKNALLFMEAWVREYYNENRMRLELRHMPMKLEDMDK